MKMQPSVVETFSLTVESTSYFQYHTNDLLCPSGYLNSWQTKRHTDAIPNQTSILKQVEAKIPIILKHMQ
jgi:hypothetical protein